ncbi:hypothetical protein [Devosia salina]|uniref:NnrS family protein n=1 Tax=Devosia salina TaxID=2860336 RepID=A0ABX8WL17_9HYPH|nr:hypothetical protein [Devosia salina]QYO77706.1 hypothetical protein K1X15_03815 [Devosia salina]
MQMATLSRWTLAYFGCALTALVVALALIGLGWAYPQNPLAAPSTLIVVHLLAIGWLSLLMLGALMQFLPVLVGRELALPGLAPVALGTILVGLFLMLCGFAALDGWLGSAELLPLGGLVVIAGFGIAAVPLFATLLRAKSLPLPAGFVTVALMSLLVAAMLGDTLAAALAGLIGGDFAVALVTHGVTLHAGFGLGGWLTLAAMGVSYRLVSMFLISPERTGWVPRVAFLSAVAGLALACAALGVLLWLNAPWPLGLAVVGLAALLALGAYLGDVVTLYRRRRRAQLELHMIAAIGAFIMLVLGVLLLTLATWLGWEGAVAAAVHLLGLGWLSGLGLAMLYKIIPFLTWLECFAPSMGRLPTPRVQDMVREAPARLGFGLYFGAVTAGAVAIAASVPALLQLAAVLQMAAVLYLIHHFYRARRLADLPLLWQDHPRPRLLWPARNFRSPT